MKKYFITGTDTDCGKTYVTTQLLKKISGSLAIKPVSSGCEWENDELVNSDARILQQHCRLALAAINPWRFRAPLSPHIAARKDGKKLVVEDIVQYCNDFHDEASVLFIEGAGGLMVPLTDHETWIDFLKISQLPVILVVGLRLGCLNHALLTETVLTLHGIQCAGWIANYIDPDMQAAEENRDTLCRLLHAPLLAEVPYGGDLKGTLDLG